MVEKDKKTVTKMVDDGPQGDAPLKLEKSQEKFQTFIIRPQGVKIEASTEQEAVEIFNKNHKK